MRDQLKECQRIIVKVGTSTITYENGQLNLKRLEELACVLSDLRNRGKDVVLVTSGAIGVGSVRMGMKTRPTITQEKQAAAAVGQAMLMQIYHNFFGHYNQVIAQILMTKEEIAKKERYDNIKNTMETLLGMGIIPIVNANDTISTYEIEISDNDNLSAIVGEVVQGDLLILLTDIDGLYTANPKNDPNAKRISHVAEITEEIQAMAGDNGSAFSVGGMKTKLEAGKFSHEAGMHMVIAQGEDPKIIYDIVDGKDVGTLFSVPK